MEQAQQISEGTSIPVSTDPRCACRRIVSGRKVIIRRCEKHARTTLVFSEDGLPELRTCIVCAREFVFLDANRKQVFCSKRCASTTHGGHKLDGYGSWKSMIDRCHNPANYDYRNYGGRGIQVCVEWRSDFQAFLRYIGRRLSRKHSVDRYPNKNGNYEPGNVRWATQKEQNRNMRTNLMVPLPTGEVVATDFAISEGVSRAAIGNRLKKGIPLDQPYFRSGPELTCASCGYTWRSTTGNPQRCANHKCRSLYWAGGQS